MYVNYPANIHYTRSYYAISYHIYSIPFASELLVERGRGRGAQGLAGLGLGDLRFGGGAWEVRRLLHGRRHHAPHQRAGGQGRLEVRDVHPEPQARHKPRSLSNSY